MITGTRHGKVLIVDDEKIIRRVINEALTKAGYNCVEACDSVEAMNQIAITRPDLVVLDIIMPGKSGIDLLTDITHAYPGIAVIMSTAIVNPKVIVDCMKFGARDYITKPFDLEEIVMSVDRALEMKRLELQIGEYQKQLENTVDDQKKQIQNIFLNSIEALVYALEAKDKYTAGHARRVTKFAVIIGKEMCLSHEELEDLCWGSLLHDVGKIALDPTVQNKQGSLTDEEYRYMMTHTIVGSSIVKPLASQKTVDIIMHHHDRYDGTGLDQTTKQDDIPLGARIVSVADSFDAMTSERPYRPALPIKHALDEIRVCSGTQFDPKVVTVFLQLPIKDIMNSATELIYINQNPQFFTV